MKTKSKFNRFNMENISNNSNSHNSHNQLKKENNLHLNTVYIYTDGACSGNPGNAGIGVFFRGYFNHIISCYIGKKTNNYAELSAIKHGISFVLKQIREGKTPNIIYIISDSKYAINVINNKNWNIIKNTKMILLIRRKLKKLKDFSFVKKVSFFYVHGHSGNPGNEQADMLAVLGKNPLKQNVSREVKKMKRFH